MSDDISRGLKKRRVSRACDYYHQRSKRCRPSRVGQHCQNCVAFDQPCTFDRPQKRRSAPPRSNNIRRATASRRQSQGTHLQAGSSDTRSSHPADRGTNMRRKESYAASEQPATYSTENVPASSRPWQAPYHATHAIIMDLVELLFEIVYPIFPFFHQPSYVRRISRAEYTSDRSLFTVTMAICALVSARVHDGAVFNPRWDVQTLREPLQDVYYD